MKKHDTLSEVLQLSQGNNFIYIHMYKKDVHATVLCGKRVSSSRSATERSKSVTKLLNSKRVFARCQKGFGKGIGMKFKSLKFSEVLERYQKGIKKVCLGKKGIQKGIEKVLEKESKYSIFLKGIKKVSERYCRKLKVSKRYQYL